MERELSDKSNYKRNFNTKYEKMGKAQNRGAYKILSNI